MYDRKENCYLARKVTICVDEATHGAEKLDEGFSVGEADSLTKKYFGKKAPKLPMFHGFAKGKLGGEDGLTIVKPKEEEKYCLYENYILDKQYALLHFKLKAGISLPEPEAIDYRLLCVGQPKRIKGLSQFIAELAMTPASQSCRDQLGEYFVTKINEWMFDNHPQIEEQVMYDSIIMTCLTNKKDIYRRFLFTQCVKEIVLRNLYVKLQTDFEDVDYEVYDEQIEDFDIDF